MIEKEDRLNAERQLEIIDRDRQRLAKGDALHRLVLDAGLVALVGDLVQRAPIAPRHAQPAALVEAGVAREADAGRLPVLLGKEAAARALLARVDIAAAAGAHDALGILDGEDTAAAVNAGLRGLELGRVEGGVLEPVDRGHVERGGDRRAGVSPCQFYKKWVGALADQKRCERSMYMPRHSAISCGRSQPREAKSGWGSVKSQAILWFAE